MRARNIILKPWPRPGRARQPAEIACWVSAAFPFSGLSRARASSACLEKGLALLLEVPEARRESLEHLRSQLEFLGLGDALEGQGEWTRARQYDKQAVAIWSQPPLEKPFSEIMSALRREAIDLIREGRPELAITSKLHTARYYYTTNVELYGINPSHNIELRPLMAALKVWAEACFLAEDKECVAQAKKALADVADTEELRPGGGGGVLRVPVRVFRERRPRVPACVSARVSHLVPGTLASQLCEKGH